MRRRQLLSGGVAALAGLGLSSAGLRSVRAQQCTTPPEGTFADLHRAPGNPWGCLENRPIGRVLEIYCYGGLAPWECFFLNPTTESMDVQWGTFAEDFAAAYAADTRKPATAPTQPYKDFFEGIALGPATWPLWDRPDLFDHLQVLVTTHDLLPHEAAIPYNLTGMRLGRPNMTGTAAPVNRNHGGNIPASYIVKPGPNFDFRTDNVLACASSGTIGAGFAPMVLDVPCPTSSTPNGGPDVSVLNRAPTTEQDRLLDHYVREYRRRLQWEGSGTSPVRAEGFDSYSAIMDQFFNLQNVKTQIQGYDPTDNAAIQGTDPFTSGARCGSEPVERDATRQALNFAAYLLNLPDTRYVCVVDVGRETASGGGGYDTHQGHVQTQYRNLSNILETIANLTDITQPGGARLDPSTLIIITTEFGRTPGAQIGSASGRNHFPYAYANLIIPPPAPFPNVPPRPARRIVGDIDTAGKIAVRGGTDIDAVTPTDIRSALLVGLGIDPFGRSDDGANIFNVGDLSYPLGAEGENEARGHLARKVLGYDV